MILERHTLYRREDLGADPVKVRVLRSYRAALKAGMAECGHGKFFVDSERQHEGASKWTEFTPQPVTLNSLAEEPEDGPLY